MEVPLTELTPQGWCDEIMMRQESLLVFSQDSAPKTATTPGRNISKPDTCSLRKAPGLKAKVGPAVSCLRRKSDSRTLGSDRALLPQRIRRVSSSGKNKVTQLYSLMQYSMDDLHVKLGLAESRKTIFLELMHDVTKAASIFCFCGLTAGSGKMGSLWRQCSPYL